VRLTVVIRILSGTRRNLNFPAVLSTGFIEELFDLFSEWAFQHWTTLESSCGQPHPRFSFFLSLDEFRDEFRSLAAVVFGSSTFKFKFTLGRIPAALSTDKAGGHKNRSHESGSGKGWVDS